MSIINPSNQRERGIDIVGCNQSASKTISMVHTYICCLCLTMFIEDMSRSKPRIQGKRREGSDWAEGTYPIFLNRMIPVRSLQVTNKITYLPGTPKEPS
jgi:hypothetical protein